MGRDARDYQIFFLGCFLILGISARDWTLSLPWIGGILLSCLAVQSVFLLGKKRLDRSALPIDWTTLKSAVITGLGLCLLLRANHFSTLLLAVTVAIASKFCLQVKGKHFFNPANLGIIAALSLTGDAWVSPGQWGTEMWLIALFLGAGGWILGQVGRGETSGVFLLVYGGLVFWRNTWLGWSSDVTWHTLSSGSLLVFALFMITDPRSIPNARAGRILWATAIALLSFILQYGFYVKTAFFWALFALSPLTLLFDFYWPAPRFQWLSPRFLNLKDPVISTH